MVTLCLSAVRIDRLVIIAKDMDGALLGFEGELAENGLKSDF